MDLKDLLGRLRAAGPPNSRGETMCKCPAHEDRTASLSVREGEKALLLYCHAGCSLESILDALGLTKADLRLDGGADGLPGRGTRVHAAKPVKDVDVAKGTVKGSKAHGGGRKGAGPLGTPTKVYGYTDEDGNLLFEVCRYDQANGKTFRQRVPDAEAAGGYRWTIRDARNVLYRLPAVLAAIAAEQPVYIVEGEKDADNLAALGLTATTNAGGASKPGRKSKWRPEHTASLAGADVYILPDNDETGVSDRRQVASQLTGTARSVRLLDLTRSCGTLPDKGDITDFFKILGKQAGLAALRGLMADTPEWTPPEGAPEGLLAKAVEAYGGVTGYCVQDGHTCQWSEDTARRLASFVAFPRALVTRDDGVNEERLMVIDGWDAGGRPLPQVRVAAKNFRAMGWALEHWAFRANIMPGNTTLDKLRYVIGEVGVRSAAHTTEYTHTGWRRIGGQWAYLHEGGAIGGGEVTVALGNGLGRYRLDGEGLTGFADIAPEDAVAASYLLTGCMARHIAVPLLACVYLAPLREALDQAGYAPSFSLFLVGETGSGKSTAAALALAHYGQFTARSLPASFHDTSNYIQKKAFLLKDMLMVVDDYHPTTSLQERRRMEATAQHLSRAFGDNAQRGRMNSDTTLREVTPPRCLAVISGEDMPDIGASGTARYHVVHVDMGDMPKDEGLTAVQELAQRGYLQRAMQGYIHWLLPQMDTLPEALGERFKALRARAQQEVRGHDRAPEAVAHLMLGYEHMLRYMAAAGLMDEEAGARALDDAWRVIASNTRQQADAAREERPTRVFLEVLRELLATGRATVRTLGKPGKDGDGFGNPQAMVGYADSDNYYLLPDVTYTMVARHTREQGHEFPLSLRRLYKQMRQDGLLVPGDKDGKSTRVKNIDGRSMRLLWVPRARLDGGERAPEQLTLDSFVPVEDVTPFDGEEGTE